MSRGRPILTQRNKLNRKLERLQKEIEELKTKLAEKLDNETETVKEEIK